MKQKVAEQVIFHNKSSLNDENSGIPQHFKAQNFRNLAANFFFFFDKSIIYIKKHKFKGGVTQLYKEYN